MMAGRPRKKTQKIYDEVGGDACFDPFDLRPRAICLSAQRTFGAEVIFISSWDGGLGRGARSPATRGCGVLFDIGCCLSHLGMLGSGPWLNLLRRLRIPH
jgi:hypothetical protein